MALHLHITVLYSEERSQEPVTHPRTESCPHVVFEIAFKGIIALVNIYIHVPKKRSDVYPDGEVTRLASMVVDSIGRDCGSCTLASEVGVVIRSVTS